MKNRVLFLSMLAVSLSGCGGGGGGSDAVPVKPAPEPVVFKPKIGDLAAVNLDSATHVLNGLDSMPIYSGYVNPQALITADGQGVIKWAFKDGTADNPLPSKSLLYGSTSGGFSNPQIIDGDSKVFMNQSGQTRLVQNDVVISGRVDNIYGPVALPAFTLPSDWPYLKSSVLWPDLVVGFSYGLEEKMPNRILDDGTLVGFGVYTPALGVADQYGLFNYTAAHGVQRTPLANELPRYLSPVSAADPTIAPRTSRPSIAGDGLTLPFLSWCTIDATRHEAVLLGALFDPKSSTVFSSFELAKVPAVGGQAECPDLDSSNGVGDAGNVAVAAVAWAQSLPRGYQDPLFNTRLNLTHVNLTGGFSARTVNIADNAGVEISQYAVSTAPTGTTTIAWVEVEHGQHVSSVFAPPTRIAFRRYTPANPLTKAPEVLSSTQYLPLSDTYGNGQDMVHLVAGPQGTLAAVWARKQVNLTYIANSDFFAEAGSIYAAKFLPSTGWTVPKMLATRFFPPQGSAYVTTFSFYPKVAINGKGQAIATFTLPAWCGEEYNLCKSTPKDFLMSSAF